LIDLAEFVIVGLIEFEGVGVGSTVDSGSFALIDSLDLIDTGCSTIGCSAIGY